MKLTPAAWTPDALEAMQPSVAASPFGRLKSAEQVLAGSHLFELQDGPACALASIRAEQHAHGIEFVITGIVNLGGTLMTARTFDAFEQLARAHQAHQLTFCTVHDQLAHAAVRRSGFERTGYVLTKRLAAPH
jgi:hypothetical protein